MFQEKQNIHLQLRCYGNMLSRHANTAVLALTGTHFLPDVFIVFQEVSAQKCWAGRPVPVECLC